MEPVVYLIAWVLVPTVLVGTVGLTYLWAMRAYDRQKRNAAISAWWAGLVLVGLVAAYHLPILSAPSFDVSAAALDVQHHLLLGGLLGMVVLMLGIERLSRTRLLPLLVFAVTFAAGLGVYGYLFIQGYHESILSISLGSLAAHLLTMVPRPMRRLRLYTG